MIEYLYNGVTLKGEKKKGTVTAKTKQEAINKVRRKNIYISEIKKYKKKKDLILFERNKVTKLDLAIFSKKMGVILNSGTPIIEAFDAVGSQIRNKKLKKAVNEISTSVQKGEEISESMMIHNDVFPDFMINMIKSGEMTGQLDDIFIRLSKQLEKEHKIQANIQKELIPPLILAIVSVIVSFFLIVFVLPTFVDLFDDFGAELPTITRLMLSISVFVKTQYLYIITTLGILIYGYKIYKKNPKGAILIDRKKLNLPIIGRLFRILLTAHFSLTFSSLLKSGVPLRASLHLTKETIKNHYIKNQINLAITKIEKGLGITESLTEIKAFPEMFISMLKIGEESGKLEEMLDTITTIYTDEAETTISRMLALVGPLLTILIAVVAFGVILSIAMPMFELYNNMDLMGWFMKRKFTLIEIIISIGIIGILMMPITNMLKESYQLFLGSNKMHQSLYEGQQTINSLSKAIRYAKPSEINTFSNGVTVKNNTFELKNNEIYVTSSTYDTLLAKGVTDFKVIEEKDNLYYIKISFENEMIGTFETKVNTHQTRKE